MPRAKMICKACGKEYEACITPNPLHVFRWFDVACSRECAEKYIHDVMVARGEIVDEEPNKESEEAEHIEAKPDEEPVINNAEPPQKSGKGKKE